MRDFDNPTPQAEIARVAETILDGEIRLVEGARRIASLRHLLDFEPDQDILFFVGLDSEADRYPLGKERLLWNLEALTKLDKEILEYEKRCTDDALIICKRLVERFRG